MTDCEAHLRAGFAVHVLLVASITVAYIVGVTHLGMIATTAAVLPLTLAGAAFPDLDYHSSLPYRYGRRVLPVVFGGLVIVVEFRYWQSIKLALVGSTGSGLGGFVSGVVVASFGWSRRKAV